MNKNDTYRRGMAAYNAGQYDQAISHLEAVSNEAGTTGLLSRFYLGRAHHEAALDHFRRSRFKEAAAHFESAARLNPVGGGVERFLAACYVKTGQFGLAVDHLETLLRSEPDNTGTRVRLALALWKNSQPEAAMDVLRKGIDRRPGDAELHYQLGVMHASRDEYPQAEEQFARAISLEPQHVDAHERLAQCCCLRGDISRTLDLLQRAHAVDPGNARIGFQLSVLAQGTGRVRPLNAVSEHKSPHVLDRASIERLGELIVQEPDFVNAFLSLPASDVDHEVFSILAATLEHALARHPEYADLHYHCGAVYRRLGRSAAAIDHAEQAVQRNPKFVAALVLLAELYAQTERWGDGVQRLEDAIRQGGDYADVHYTLGRLLQKTGQSDRARHAFERALVLNRRYQPARDALLSVQGPSHSPFEVQSS